MVCWHCRIVDHPDDDGSISFHRENVLAVVVIVAAVGVVIAASAATAILRLVLEVIMGIMRTTTTTTSTQTHRIQKWLDNKTNHQTRCLPFFFAYVQRRLSSDSPSQSSGPTVYIITTTTIEDVEEKERTRVTSGKWTDGIIRGEANRAGIIH